MNAKPPIANELEELTPAEVNLIYPGAMRMMSSGVALRVDHKDILWAIPKRRNGTCQWNTATKAYSWDEDKDTWAIFWYDNQNKVWRNNAEQ